MRIKQGRVSPTIGFPFLETYGLEEYKSLSDPTIFFGCYNPPTDFSIIMNHIALGVVVWCGTDAQIINPGKLRAIASKKNIKHVAMGSFVEADLQKAGIECVKLPLTNAPINPNPIPLGEAVYTYAPTFRYNYYGGQIIDRLKKETDYEIIVTSPKQYTKDELFELYARSFIGLRLTLHDGLAHTAMELALLGRRVVYNDDIPGAIPWIDYNSVLRAIEAESKNIGKTNYVLAHETASFLTISEDWLHTEFWT